MSPLPTSRHQVPRHESVLALAAGRPWDAFAALLGGLGICGLAALHLFSTGRLSSPWAVFLFLCAWFAATWMSTRRARHKPLLDLTDIGRFQHTIKGYRPNGSSPGAIVILFAAMLCFMLLTDPQNREGTARSWLLAAAYGAPLIFYLGSFHNTLIFTDIGLFHRTEPWWRPGKHSSRADFGSKAALVCTWDEVTRFRFTFPYNRDVLQLTMRQGAFGSTRQLNLTMPLSHAEIKSLDALLREYVPAGETDERQIEKGQQLAPLR